MSQNNSLIIVAVLTLIIGLVGGYLFHSVSGEGTTSKCPSEQQIREDFVKELRNEDVIPLVPESINRAEGTITKVEGDRVTIKTKPKFSDPLHKYLLETITAKIDENTKLVAQIAKEKKSTTSPPLSYYTQEEIELSDLEVGQWASVQSDQNFKGKSEVKASNIRVLVEPEE